MDNRTPELIEAEMAQTRQSLAEKVAVLEDKVVGTVHSASAAVKDTVSTVRSAVEGTVESVKAGVTTAFDLSGHVRRHPSAMVGGATAVGFAVGFTLPRRIATAHHSPTLPAVSEGPPVRHAGFLDKLFGRLSDELCKVGEAAVMSLSAVAKRAVDEKLPMLVDRLLEPGPARSAQAPLRRIGQWNGAYAG